MRIDETTVLLVLGIFGASFCCAAKDSAIKVNPLRRVCFYCISQDNLTPEDLDPALCNYIIVCQVTAVNNFVVPQNESDVEVYPRIMELKTKNAELKVMLLLLAGNSTHGLPVTVLDISTRYEFINRLAAFLVKHKFDGVDVDWEFPAWQTGNVDEKHLFTVFLQDLHNALAIFGRLTTGVPLLLSVDVAAPKVIIDESYEPVQLANNVDFINIMSYDYHFYTSSMPATGHNSALFNRKDEKDYFATLNTAWSANYWVLLGVPKEKINVGIPTYGHSFRLLHPEEHGVYAPATGLGISNGWTEYYQVCVFLKSNGTKVFDEEALVPYAYNDTDWISYDDIESVALKTQWIRTAGFGGVMTFNLNCDDWRGICNNVTFPLHKAILTITETPIDFGNSVEMNFRSHEAGQLLH